MNKIKKFIKDDGGRYRYFPLTTKRHKVGDCVIRAISIASGLDYKKVMKDLFERALDQGDFPNYERVYEPYLEELGFVKQKPQYHIQYDEAKDENGILIHDHRDMPLLRKVKRKKRLQDVDVDHNKSYIFLTRKHVTAVVNGEHRDIWNCGRWCANSYYERKEVNHG